MIRYNSVKSPIWALFAFIITLVASACGDNTTSAPDPGDLTITVNDDNCPGCLEGTEVEVWTTNSDGDYVPSGGVINNDSATFSTDVSFRQDATIVYVDLDPCVELSEDAYSHPLAPSEANTKTVSVFQRDECDGGETGDTGDTGDTDGGDPVCGDELIEGQEVCDGESLNGETCLSQGFDGGTLKCADDCGSYDTSECTTDEDDPVCGDNVVEDPEVCDGESLNGETCLSQGFDGGMLACANDCGSYDTSGCTTDEVCGNDIVEGTEQCDNADLNGETCGSLGFADGTLLCSNSCTFDTSQCIPFPICGNGELEGAEECDDGNAVDDDACSNACVINFCGDGIANNGETCDGDDLGENVCQDGDYTCDNQCELVTDACVDDSVCSDGEVTAGEECDDGNLINGDACSDQCLIEVPNCGDGILQFPEECDDGNGVDDDACSNACELNDPAVCGNGIQENPEECDDGNAVDDDACSNACIVNFCGDGLVNNGEACDDGNAVDDDACSNACVINFCGDGIANNGETCDGDDLGGNVCVDGLYTCDDQCELETDMCEDDSVCSDGEVTAGEQCDDGNLVNNDGCDDQCQLEPANCGNGIHEFGEQCDDGNLIDDDACSNMCEVTFCSDGELNNGEACDDGNLVNGDGCNDQCEAEALNCGDGILQLPETCDDGNNVGGDGCAADCTLEGAAVCQNGVHEAGEECDDGNGVNGDGCNDQCELEGLNLCGNGVIDPGEQCDGLDLDGQTCDQLGYNNGGGLSCNPQTCQFDTTFCVGVDPFEACWMTDNDSWALYSDFPNDRLDTKTQFGQWDGLVCQPSTVAQQNATTITVGPALVGVGVLEEGNKWVRNTTPVAIPLNPGWIQDSVTFSAAELTNTNNELEITFTAVNSPKP